MERGWLVWAIALPVALYVLLSGLYATLADVIAAADFSWLVDLGFIDQMDTVATYAILFALALAMFGLLTVIGLWLMRRLGAPDGAMVITAVAALVITVVPVVQGVARFWGLSSLSDVFGWLVSTGFPGLAMLCGVGVMGIVVQYQQRDPVSDVTATDDAALRIDAAEREDMWSGRAQVDSDEPFDTGD